MRKERADAARNREAALAAAARLFAERGRPEHVSMDEIAVAAGVGKGTLFRRFGDRTGLIRALIEQRTEDLRTAVAQGPPPLGPGAPAPERILALLDALLAFKLANRPLTLALENAGTGSPYQNTTYSLVHAQLAALIAQARTCTPQDADFLAHGLLAAVRADLIEHLSTTGTPPDQMHAGLRTLCRSVVGT